MSGKELNKKMKFECCKKFPKGARVEVIDEVPLVSRFSKDWSPKNYLKVGSEGTIVDNDNEGDEWVGIKWDQHNEHMHDCGGLGGCKDGHGWYVRPGKIRIIKT